MSTPPLQPLIQSRILSLRAQRVMLDADLAQLYDVETRAVVQAVKRNAQRFPADFMFQLDATEWDSLRSQTVISNAAGPGRGGRRTPPYAFTEQGVAMLSTVLSSERAVAVNIEIMLAHPRMQGLRHAANLGCNRFNGSPHGGVVAPVLSHHADSAFTNFRGKTV